MEKISCITKNIFITLVELKFFLKTVRYFILVCKFEFQRNMPCHYKERTQKNV